MGQLKRLHISVQLHCCLLNSNNLKNSDTNTLPNNCTLAVYSLSVQLPNW